MNGSHVGLGGDPKEVWLVPDEPMKLKTRRSSKIEVVVTSLIDNKLNV